MKFRLAYKYSVFLTYIKQLTMSSEKFLIPDLTQEEQDIFHNAFAKDLENLKTNAAISYSFSDIFVTICKMPSLSILKDKEAQNILELSDLHSKRKAVLTYADERGSRALVVFYLLLHIKDETAYKKLPSCQENDKKMALLSKLRDKYLTSLEKKVAEISQTFTKPHSQGVTKPVASVAARPHITRNHGDTDISVDENDKWDQKYKDNEDDQPPPYDTVMANEAKHSKPYRGRGGIKRGDVLFHFITLCFALGTVLVVEHNLSDWTVSAGIGLISFAFLEAIGFYFNFVNRVRTVARAILQFILRWAEKFPLGFLRKDTKTQMIFHN
ncbi:transmembrane protein 40 isoform X2 [Rana temporaria]|uniref:transmembrane protein 40 isoform X2 n=1 Tax=Rana temporaria TaxID=8407 RepID=UPI001AACE1A4|nr:transmembrane protein 40 isoform X2 [Rana temporaria]